MGESTTDRAVELLMGAQRIFIYGNGPSRMLAELAVNEPEAFASLVQVAASALPKA